MEGTCNWCNKLFTMNRNQIYTIKKKPKTPIFCSRQCSGKFYAKKSHNKTEEEKRIINQKISQSIKKHDANLTPEQIKLRVKNWNKYWDELSPEQRSLRNKSNAIKSKQTKMEKYGDPTFNNKEKTKITVMEKYGTTSTFSIPKALENKKKIQESLNRKIKEVKQHKFSDPKYKKAVIDKMEKTNLKKYGVRNYTLCSDYTASHNIISKLNKKIADILNISEFEKTVGNYRYDLCFNKIVIEINPIISHNVSKSYAFITGLDTKNKPINIDYHYNRTKNAEKCGYKCIHIFDWDDPNKIKYLIHKPQKLFASDFICKEITKDEALDFIKVNNINATFDGDIFFGLYKDNTLYQLITFGKHQRSNKWDYEIFNFITLLGYNIVGGYNKIINMFISTYKPVSICTYIDISKYTRKEFEKIGFRYRKTIKPKLWIYENKTKIQVNEYFIPEEKLPVPDCGYYLMYYKF